VKKQNWILKSISYLIPKNLSGEMSRTSESGLDTILLVSNYK